MTDYEKAQVQESITKQAKQYAIDSQNQKADISTSYSRSFIKAAENTLKKGKNGRYQFNDLDDDEELRDKFSVELWRAQNKHVYDRMVEMQVFADSENNKDGLEASHLQNIWSAEGGMTRSQMSELVNTYRGDMTPQAFAQRINQLSNQIDGSTAAYVERNLGKILEKAGIDGAESKTEQAGYLADIYGLDEDKLESVLTNQETRFGRGLLNEAGTNRGGLERIIN